MLAQVGALAAAVIALPSAALTNVPANMAVLCNIPSELCWGIALRAAAILVPLKSEQTCCGHITLVSARLLGIPLITTRSMGTVEYSEGYAGTWMVEPSDADGWIGAIRRLLTDSGEIDRAAAADAVVAAERHDRTRWAEYVADFVRRVG